MTPERLRRLATFLALNQKNESVIYLNAWLHHLRRADTAFHEADREVIPLICTKLMRNEKVLRSWLESCGHLKSVRVDYLKVIQIPDLRQVLSKFGVSSINQDMFIKEFTKGEAAQVEELIEAIKSRARKFY